MDRLFIHKLRVPVQVGILSHERAGKQFVSIDIVFNIDAKQAALFDDVRYTIDYGNVREDLIHF